MNTKNAKLSWENLINKIISLSQLAFPETFADACSLSSLRDALPMLKGSISKPDGNKVMDAWRMLRWPPLKKQKKNKRWSAGLRVCLSSSVAQYVVGKASSAAKPRPRRRSPERANFTRLLKNRATVQEKRETERKGVKLDATSNPTRRNCLMK